MSGIERRLGHFIYLLLLLVSYAVYFVARRFMSLSGDFIVTFLFDIIAYCFKLTYEFTLSARYFKSFRCFIVQLNETVLSCALEEGKLINTRDNK